MKSYTEIENVKKVIENYIKGSYEANIDLLKEVFHKDAKMSGHMGEEILIGTPEPFFEDLKSRPSMKEAKDDFNAEILSINITEEIASVVLYQTGFFGDGCIEDHFHLMKDENENWKILSKTFTTL